MPRLLLIDDDRFLLRSLEKLFAREGYVCKCVHTVNEAGRALVQSATGEPFDLVVLDVGLPDGDGVSFCRQLRTRHRMPIMLLTARQEITDKVIGLEVGADDYLTKPFDPRELLARTRAQLRRAGEYMAEPAVQPARLDLGRLVLYPEAHEVWKERTQIRLTEREFELLHLLARHAGRALASNWIFEQVWGFTADHGLKALNVYVRRLREKIEDDASRPEQLLTVRGFGYKLVPQPRS